MSFVFVTAHTVILNICKIPLRGKK